jgi:hypothetical protein
MIKARQCFIKHLSHSGIVFSKHQLYDNNDIATDAKSEPQCCQFNVTWCHSCHP